MLDAPWANPWFRRIGIAVSYGLLIVLARQVTISHFVLVAGIHLAVLLLFRYRDWPALIVGETFALLPTSIECVGQFGVAWAVIYAIPGLVAMAPFVYILRERWPVLASRGGLNMGALLGGRWCCPS